ncbi:MAG TPA: signal peptidase I [Bdellovibrionota bacterium]|nr:signal peptidase I [Bdellovibrionota bacterium]
MTRVEMLRERWKSMRPLTRQYGAVILGAAIAAMAARSCLIETFRIPTDSMRPGILRGDMIAVDKWTYGLRPPGFAERWTSGRSPEPGDVVVYSGADGGSYLKRVVGAPGDTVGLLQGHVYLNGKALEFQPLDGRCGRENHPRAGAYAICLDGQPADDMAPATVAPGYVFLAPDSRERGASDDPGGMIPLSRIVGRARWIWLSLEPRGPADSAQGFPAFRLDRMFHRVL